MTSTLILAVKVILCLKTTIDKQSAVKIHYIKIIFKKLLNTLWNHVIYALSQVRAFSGIEILEGWLSG